MSQQEISTVQRQRLSLSVKVSLALVVAAIMPLLITLGLSEWQTRPQLVAKANNAMQSDAKTRVQLIDTYFHERLLDTLTITQVPSVQEFLAAPTNATNYATLATHAQYGLSAGTFRDKNYTTWALFDPKGQLRLSYPTQPQAHGQFLAPRQDFQAVVSGKNFISPVYYSPQTKKASVDIYAPIATPQIPGKVQQKPTLLGFLRASLNLDYIWNIVAGDKGNNGANSYAFILDQNGVRIADTNSKQLFTSVQPLPAAVQQQISQEERFGSRASVPLQADSTLARKLQSTATISDFQLQPGGQTETFQAVDNPTTIVPWHYFVLSPLNTVTAVADQQLFVTLLVAFGMSTVVALLGLIVGQGITRPILRSVQNLRSNSVALSSLAERQRDAASEQMWVVDSSQVGLQSVQYYTDATKVAARQLNDVGTELVHRWQYMDPRATRRGLEQIVTASRYIEEAANHQSSSNQKLATALKVATQVTEQLATGATSATDAASQLEDVVQQLRNVVGR
jgi:methyl-accepting chemotaxis protein